MGISDDPILLQSLPQCSSRDFAFAICFAAWGLMSAVAPYFRDLLHLDATQTALLVIVLFVRGSLARIPMWMLADRVSGRATLTGLMLVVAVPTALVATA